MKKTDSAKKLEKEVLDKWKKASKKEKILSFFGLNDLVDPMELHTYEK